MKSFDIAKFGWSNLIEIYILENFATLPNLASNKEKSQEKHGAQFTRVKFINFHRTSLFYPCYPIFYRAPSIYSFLYATT